MIPSSLVTARCPCSCQGPWTRWPSRKGLLNPKHSTILRSFPPATARGAGNRARVPGLAGDQPEILSAGNTTLPLPGLSPTTQNRCKGLAGIRKSFVCEVEAALRARGSCEKGKWDTPGAGGTRPCGGRGTTPPVKPDPAFWSGPELNNARSPSHAMCRVGGMLCLAFPISGSAPWRSPLPALPPAAPSCESLNKAGENQAQAVQFADDLCTC